MLIGAFFTSFLVLQFVWLYWRINREIKKPITLILDSEDGITERQVMRELSRLSD
jgi:hypothetical protein